MALGNKPGGQWMLQGGPMGLGWGTRCYQKAIAPSGACLGARVMPGCIPKGEWAPEVGLEGRNGGNEPGMAQGPIQTPITAAGAGTTAMVGDDL